MAGLTDFNEAFRNVYGRDPTTAEQQRLLPVAMKNIDQGWGGTGLFGPNHDAINAAMQDNLKGQPIGTDWNNADPVTIAHKAAAAGPSAANQAAVGSTSIADMLKTQFGQNPYMDMATGQMSPLMQQYVQQQQQQNSLQFGNQQHALSGQLAGRGMMGSGAEVAQRSALGGAQAASQGSIYSQAMNQALNGAAGYQQGVMGQLGQQDMFGRQMAVGSDQFNRSLAAGQEQNYRNNAIQNQGMQNSWMGPMAQAGGTAAASALPMILAHFLPAAAAV